MKNIKVYADRKKGTLIRIFTVTFQSTWEDVSMVVLGRQGLSDSDTNEIRNDVLKP
jgi:hypothetical protein